MKMDKANIVRNFSRSAHFYDRYADVQKKAAAELLDRLRSKKFDSILEIGCGTGNYCFLLKEKFAQARLKALDISEKMIEVCRDKLKDKKVELMVADGERIDLPEKFDLITSNACFQWFEDLGKALGQYKNMLQKGGLLSFSVFGPLTFRELGASLRSLSKDADVAATRFIDKERLKAMLAAHFSQTQVEEIVYEKEFSSLSDLLKNIKYTGTGGAGLNGQKKAFLGAKKLRDLEAVYLRRFKRIRATYQVFFCRGLKA